MPKDERKDLYGRVSLELMAYMDAQKSCSKATHDIVDKIMELIDAQRCVWTKDGERDGQDIYLSSCDMVDFLCGYTFCPKCGRRIEVTEGEDG